MREKTAVDVVGTVKPSTKRIHTSNSQVAMLVERGHELRLSLNNNSQTLDKKSVRKEINWLKKNIGKRLKEISYDADKTLAEEITSMDSSRRMFEAVCQLTDRRKPPNICVKDDDGVTAGCMMLIKQKFLEIILKISTTTEKTSAGCF